MKKSSSSGKKNAPAARASGSFGDCKPKHLSSNNTTNKNVPATGKKNVNDSKSAVAGNAGSKPKQTNGGQKKVRTPVVPDKKSDNKPAHIDSSKKSAKPEHVSADKEVKKAAPKKKFNWRIALGCVFAATFCLSAVMLIKEQVQARQEKSTFDDLAQIVAEAATATTPATPKETQVTESLEPGEETTAPLEELYNDEEYTGMLPEYAPLYERNKDFFGWIKLDGTDINYPVMYTPNDPEHYIHKDFYGSYSACGCPFIDARNPIDGNYLIIYGHHMKNKTMFGQLPNYEKKSYYESHKVIRFDTLYEHREYEVVACFYSRLYAKNETGVFRYYNYGELSTEADFKEYMRQVNNSKLYDTGVDVKYGDDILVLSTCAYQTANGRFVVVARHRRSI